MIAEFGNLSPMEFCILGAMVFIGVAWLTGALEKIWRSMTGDDYHDDFY